MGWSFGCQLGNMEDIDTGLSRECLGKYLRIRMTIDITWPLEKGLKIVWDDENNLSNYYYPMNGSQSTTIVDILDIVKAIVYLIITSLPIHQKAPPNLVLNPPKKKTTSWQPIVISPCKMILMPL